MDQINSFKKIYKIVNVITCTSIMLLLLCFMLSFDAASGYLANSALSTLFFVVYIAGAVVSLTAIFVPSEFDSLETPDEMSGKSKFYFACVGTASVVVGAFSLILKNNVVDFQTLLYSGIGLIAFGIYLILTATLGMKFNLIKIISLLVSIMLPFSIGTGNNNNYYHHINSIENTLTVFFAIAFLFFILHEAKRMCTGVHSEWHFVSMLLTYISSLSISVAYMVAFVLDSVNEGYRFYQMLMILLVGLSMMFKINSFIASLTPKSKFSSTTSHD